MCWSLFLIKLQVFRPKDSTTQVLSCEIDNIFKNSYLHSTSGGCFYILTSQLSRTGLCFTFGTYLNLTVKYGNLSESCSCSWHTLCKNRPAYVNDSYLYPLEVQVYVWETKLLTIIYHICLLTSFLFFIE